MITLQRVVKCEVELTRVIRGNHSDDKSNEQWAKDEIDVDRFRVRTVNSGQQTEATEYFAGLWKCLGLQILWCQSCTLNFVTVCRPSMQNIWFTDCLNDITHIRLNVMIAFGKIWCMIDKSLFKFNYYLLLYYMILLINYCLLYCKVFDLSYIMYNDPWIWNKLN
jgi:hypothetical protein